jgi:spermidine synthase
LLGGDHFRERSIDSALERPFRKSGEEQALFFSRFSEDAYKFFWPSGFIVVVISSQSQFPQIDVIETYFGKTLITDGKMQSTPFDEFAYHESLVHTALLNFAYYDGREAKKVFIGGGGELATAREVLRHTQVERVVMVDLDEKVVEVSVKYLPEWGGEAVKSDPRLELIIGDAYAYLLNTKEIFDVIILDILDPIEAGPGIMLYTKELYQHAATVLSSPYGVFVTQAGTADGVPPPHSNTGEKDTVCFGPIINTLGEVFRCVLPYTQSIPSFGSDWGFVMAFNPTDIIIFDEKKEGGDDVTKEDDDCYCWATIAPAVIDSLVEKYIQGGESSLRMYDGITHQRMISLTKALRKQLASDNRVMTKDNPIFMY